jgi:hypothetical protein
MRPGASVSEGLDAASAARFETGSLSASASQLGSEGCRLGTMTAARGQQRSGQVRSFTPNYFTQKLTRSRQNQLGTAKLKSSFDILVLCVTLRM